MKTIKKISVLFLATIISSFALSCSSSDDGGSGGNASEGTITAKVNGASFTSLEMTTFANQVGAMISIQGNTGGTTSKAIALNITGFEGVGTYDIGGGTTGLGGANASYTEIVVNISNPTASQTTTWAAPYTGGNKVGEIKVSEYVEGEYIKGTFYFEAKNQAGEDKKNITDGSFFVNF